MPFKLFRITPTLILFHFNYQIYWYCFQRTFLFIRKHRRITKAGDTINNSNQELILQMMNAEIEVPPSGGQGAFI